MESQRNPGTSRYPRPPQAPSCPACGGKTVYQGGSVSFDQGDRGKVQVVRSYECVDCGSPAEIVQRFD